MSECESDSESESECGSREIQVELLELIAKFDPQFDYCLHGRLEDSRRGVEGGRDCTGVSSDIQNDIIEYVDSVIQDEIDKEIAG